MRHPQRQQLRLLYGWRAEECKSVSASAQLRQRLGLTSKWPVLDGNWAQNSLFRGHRDVMNSSDRGFMDNPTLGRRTGSVETRIAPLKVQGLLLGLVDGANAVGGAETSSVHCHLADRLDSQWVSESLQLQSKPLICALSIFPRRTIKFPGWRGVP